MEFKGIKLPEYASVKSDEKVIAVETLAQALELMTIIPEKYDNDFEIEITNEVEYCKALILEGLF